MHPFPGTQPALSRLSNGVSNRSMTSIEPSSNCGVSQIADVGQGPAVGLLASGRDCRAGAVGTMEG